MQLSGSVRVLDKTSGNLCFRTGEPPMNSRNSDSIRIPNALAVFSFAMLSLIALGCEKRAEAKVPVAKITVIEEGPFSVVAEFSKKSPAEGVIFAQAITVTHQDKLQISSVQGAVFYDSDQSGSLDRDKDGVILTFDDTTMELAQELTISPGVVHAGPGIGPLRLECEIEVVSKNGVRTRLPLSADLSPIFK